MNIESTKEYERGSAAERFWCKHITKFGILTLPVYAMKNCTKQTPAPVLFSKDDILIAPDILCFLPDGRMQWHEVKDKTVPTFYRNKQRWEHGIDYFCFLNYRKIEEQTKLPIWIISNEEKSPGPSCFREEDLTPSNIWFKILFKTVCKLGERRVHWPGGNGSGDYGKLGMGGWLWPRNAMQRVSL